MFQCVKPRERPSTICEPSAATDGSLQRERFVSTATTRKMRRKIFSKNLKIWLTIAKFERSIYWGGVSKTS